jgi:hypothetical protein
MAGFTRIENTKGPDGATNVPKCSNLANVREKIRENKKSSLEEIIELLITHCERHDDIIPVIKAAMQLECGACACLICIPIFKIGGTSTARLRTSLLMTGQNLHPLKSHQEKTVLDIYLRRFFVNK